MEVVKNQIDELNLRLTINVAHSDVAEDVEKSLKDYRKKAVVPGFRQGNVPVGMIKKMYGTAILVEELNKKISTSLNEYITNEGLNILGEPLPAENQEEVVLEKQDNYSFNFDIGLSPEFEMTLSKRDKLNKYNIKVDDDMMNKYISSYQQRYGTFFETNESDEESMLEIDLSQIDEQGNLVENGIVVNNVNISVKFVKDEEIKKRFVGVHQDDVIDFDIKKAFPNDVEIASLLKIEKEAVETLEPNFRAVVKVIKEFKNAEIDQEFFDQCFGENTVSNEEEFNEKVREDIRESFVRDSKYKLMIDLKEKLIKKCNFALPEAFLKRWIKVTNREITDEQIEQEFGRFIEDLRWTLIKNKYAKANEVKVTEEDLIRGAKQQILQQFMQYGMAQVPEEYLNKYAQEILKKEGEANKIFEIELEQKVVDLMENAVKLEEKEVSLQEFQAFFEQI